ncbi:pilus assembly protein [Arthrobacter sp. PsM3]|uniref:pilus assembly protein n=1 Tax=Arthrobacter sp. PsM3 TaxID=3030531 RepID=UPI00263B7536|nr:pilus assembly protein TadG-related protein [Arthrobacter sp. PsM3]MDN4642707.1 pilus assembly protein TadG-related protein [Arthrobacter sp. PsM3]
MKEKNNPGKASRERGAAAVIFALTIPVLFGALAMALDVGALVYERQHLSNALDAGALAGAASLPGDPVAARNAAISFARANDPAAAPTVTFWCVVASTGAARTVQSSQIPSVCNAGTTSGARCDMTICAIPCIPGTGISCNSITVTDDKNVAFQFAPVIGINTGNTGSLASDACKGSCGSQSPNPMDIAIVADRTSSMSDQNITDMKTGIKNTLLTMSRDQQYVAFGTIHRSSPIVGGCQTNPSGSATEGPWIPVPFSNDYNSPGTTPTANGNSTLVKAISCLNKSSGFGTYLASPLKAAARYVLGKDPNNLLALPARAGTARKAIILETDGQPNESNMAGSTAVNTPGDIGSSTVAAACKNLKDVAADAKFKDILIITVGFGSANTDSCGSGVLVRDVLAAAASEKSPGVASTASNDCQTPAKRAAENADGDFFFCAASGSELGPIFVSAINAISGNSHLIRIPG